MSQKELSVLHQSINFIKTTVGENKTVPMINKEAIRLIKTHKANGGWQKRTKSVFFSVKLLTELMEHLKEITEAGNGLTGSGCRFYFAQYPDHRKYDLERRGRETLVLVPTYQEGPYSEDGVNIDEVPKEEVRTASTEIDAEENSAQRREEEPVSEMEATSSMLADTAFNHGQMCPIRCPGSTITVIA